MVIHLVSEKGHEEREAAGVSRAGLRAVESLREHNSTDSIIHKSNIKQFHCCLSCMFNLCHKDGEINRNKGTVLI